MKRSRDPTVLFSSALLMLACDGIAANGQSRSMFGSQGPASQIGSNLRGSIVGQSSTFGGGAGFGGGVGGLSATGMGGIGGLSGQTITGNLGTSEFGTGLGVGQAGAASGFVGRNNTTGGFVGDQRIGQMGTPAAGAGFTSRQFSSRFGGRGGGRGAQQAGFEGGRFGSTGEVTGEAARRVIRPRPEIAFEYDRRDSEAVSGRLATRLEQISRRQPDLQGISIDIRADGAVILTGTVDSENARKLAGVLARLEPGVRLVVNELEIAVLRKTPPQ
jgi:hypothetical protein